MLRLLVLLPLLPIAACATPVQHVLPLAPGVRGASHVAEVRAFPVAHASDLFAPFDEKAARRTDGEAALPTAAMIERAMVEAAREAGLAGGRALRLEIEIDRLETADAAEVLLTSIPDRISGTVFVRDAASGEPLGQLYVDVGNRQSGLVGLAMRSGGARERLAAAFARQVAAALSAR